MSGNKKRIAIIGAGISGLAAAHTLQKRGHEVLIYERSQKIGGVWANSYPKVSLQNTYQQYHISDFPYPTKPDWHPTGEQILQYFDQAVKALKLNVHVEHTIKSMKEMENGWELTIEHNSKTITETFDYVIVAVGQYTDRKNQLALPDQDKFKGEVISEVEVKDLKIFDNKKVVVVGFGKSALDMATLSARQGAEVHHVFRTPRWIIPFTVMGIDFTRPFFARFSSVMIPSWVQPTDSERFLHKHMGFVVNGFWKFISALFRFEKNKAAFGKGSAAHKRLAMVTPPHDLLPDLRSAAALTPEGYFPFIADGKIQPYQAEVAGFTESGILLKNGGEIACDIVVAAVGSTKPTFPFMLEKYRHMLESEPDGVQLYRHLIHPHIPNLGFAGFNHGFMHIASVEVGTLWLSAVFSGEMELPSIKEMEETIEYVRQWKRDHINFEPSRLVATNTRYQQYLDVLLQDLGMSRYRKAPNFITEIFARYGASDYAGVVEEYERMIQKRATTPKLRPIAVHT